MSQIGYMIMGVGVGAYEGGVAHFFTHAFFKAQLFLGSGHHHPRARKRAGRAAHGRPAEEVAVCVRRYGDRRARDHAASPVSAGFFSKDQVIYGALAHGYPWLYALGIVTAGITAYYMCRMLFITFFGHVSRRSRSVGSRHPPPRARRNTASGESPDADDVSSGHHATPNCFMIVPVAILIVPTVFIGWFDVRRRELAVGAFLRAAIPASGAGSSRRLAKA